MNKNLYTACGAMALSLAACSSENGSISGTSTDPNTMALPSRLRHCRKRLIRLLNALTGAISKYLPGKRKILMAGGKILA